MPFVTQHQPFRVSVGQNKVLRVFRGHRAVVIDDPGPVHRDIGSKAVTL